MILKAALGTALALLAGPLWLRISADAEHAAGAPLEDQGLHCFDENGVHAKTIERAKESLVGGDMFFHKTSLILPINSENKHTLVMKYRVIRNDGAVSDHEALAKLDEKNCRIRYYRSIVESPL